MVSRRDFIKRTLASAASCGVFGAAQPALWAKEKNVAKNVEFKLLAQRKRGTESYTQGLSYFFDPKEKRASLYESGGRYGRSLLRRVDAETLEVIRQVKIPREYFAEGIAIVGDRLCSHGKNTLVLFSIGKRSFRSTNFGTGAKVGDLLTTAICLR